MDTKKEISELKQALLKAHEDIEKLSRIKSDFVSIISHELRTPLTSIKESVSLLLDEIAGPISEEQKKFLTITKNSIDRLVKIVTDILDFSKLESGRITMHKRKMDVNIVVKDVYSAVKDSVEQKNIKFDLDLSDSVEPTWLDPDRIGQALKGMISNAVKFNKENGTILIRTGREDLDGRQFVKVTVEDSGIGIAKEDIPMLFKRFTPLDTSMTRKYRGVGLGLAICKGIVGLHGGDIWAESDESVGSRFIFTIPIYKKDAEFNFLLDEALERSNQNNFKTAFMVFKISDAGKADEGNYARLEKDIASAVRGPEDKVIQYKDGNSIAVIANTDKDGAMKIIKRVNEKIKSGVKHGMAIYPDDTHNKKDLIAVAEKELA